MTRLVGYDRARAESLLASGRPMTGVVAAVPTAEEAMFVAEVDLETWFAERGHEVTVHALRAARQYDGHWVVEYRVTEGAPA